MKPELTFQDDYEVPLCTLPEDHPMRRQGVIMTRVPGGWDVRIGLPMHITLSDVALAGQPIGERSEEIARNVGTMMTNDLWLEIVPLIKETLSRANADVG